MIRETLARKDQGVSKVTRVIRETRVSLEVVDYLAPVFTMHGGINMNANRITYVPDPLTNNEPVTKQYGNRTYLTNAGFVMQHNIGMNNHMVTNLGTPTNDTDAATKEYSTSLE